AAVGSAVSQLAGKAMGVVDHFSWSQVGVSALTAGLTAGVGAGIGQLASKGYSWAQTANNAINAVNGVNGVKATWTQAVGVGAYTGAVSYGSNYVANQVFGNSQSFSWAALGSSVIGSMAGASLGKSGAFNALGKTASPYAYSLASANAAVTIEDKWFGGSRPDYLNVSMAAIANTVGRQFGENAKTSSVANNKRPDYLNESILAHYRNVEGMEGAKLVSIVGSNDQIGSGYAADSNINYQPDESILDKIENAYYSAKDSVSDVINNVVDMFGWGNGNTTVYNADGKVILPTLHYKATDNNPNIIYALGGLNSTYNMSAALARVEQKVMLQRESDISAAYNRRTWAERAESAKYSGGFIDAAKYVGQQILFKAGEAFSFGLLNRSDQRLLQVRQGQLSFDAMRNANMTEAGVGGAVTLATGGSFNTIRAVGGAALARIGVGRTAQYYGGLAIAGAGSGVLMDAGVQTSERISFGMSDGLTGRSEYDFGQIALSGGIGGAAAPAFGGLAVFAGSKYNVNLQSPIYFDTSAGRVNSGLPLEFRTPIISGSNTDLSYGEILRQKYGHISIEDRRAIINDRLESIAAQRLDSLEQSIPNAHFKGRHGAQTTLQQQYERAVNGIDPVTQQPRYRRDGNLATPNSTRFLSHRDQINAIERATAIYKRTGSKVLAESPIRFGSQAGEGYYGGSGVYDTSLTVQVWFRNAQPVTAFPILGQ
ncbi:hypothetical protein, partial [Acinetobacter modestus]